MRFFEKISFEQFKKDISDSRELYDSITLPKRSTSKSAGYDIKSMENIIIKPREHVKIKTGLKVCMNDDEVLYIFSRSSLGLKYGVTMANSVGVIDSLYHKEIGIIVDNIGTEEYTINAGDRIAQFILIQTPYIVFNEDKIEDNERGGFGSTGIWQLTP